MLFLLSCMYGPSTKCLYPPIAPLRPLQMFPHGAVVCYVCFTKEPVLAVVQGPSPHGEQMATVPHWGGGRPLLKVGPTLPPGGGWVGGSLACGWVGYFGFGQFGPKCLLPPRGGVRVGVGGWVGGWVGGSATLMGLTQQLGRGRD